MQTKMNNIEEFADEILQSASKMERAKAPDFLLNHILEEIAQENEIVPVYKLKWIAIAASLLIGVNIISIASESKDSATKNSSENSSENILSNYDLYKN